MRRMKKKPEVAKTCPLLNEKCLKTGCEIYNPLLDRCDISVASYNLYRLSEAIRQDLEGESRPEIQ